MGVRPIDLQSTINQMPEVGKHEQARNDGVIQQQHVLDTESNEKSRLTNTKLDEAKKGEKTAIKEGEGGVGGQTRRRKKKKENGVISNEKKKEQYRDSKLGNLIDVFK